MRNPSSPNRSHSGKVLGGFILVAVGAVLLMHRLDLFFFPKWLFSWPMMLIAIGFFVGARHNFRNPAWLILVTIGIIFLAEKFYPDINARNYIWPILFIIFGLYMIMGRNRRPYQGNLPDPNYPNPDGGFNHPYEFTGNPTTPGVSGAYDGSATNYTTNPTPDASTPYNPYNSSSDYLVSTSVFGGVKKNIISKNFQGGEITTFLGGAEINLGQADINGRVVLDVTQVMGGTRIIVPPHWDVVSEVAAVFGGVEDKRFLQSGTINPNKVLIIRGTSFMGGIDIRSY